ncbi:hypothetical protein FQZ97_1260730 [compost metagenome]
MEGRPVFAQLIAGLKSQRFDMTAIGVVPLDQGVDCICIERPQLFDGASTGVFELQDVESLLECATENSGELDVAYSDPARIKLAVLLDQEIEPSTI